MATKVGPPVQSSPVDVYERAGFGGNFERGQRPAVVVVDFINGFTDPAIPTGAEMGAPIESANVLIRAARAIGAPVVFTTISYEPAELELAWLRKSRGLTALRAGTPFVEVDARCDRTDDDLLLVKKQASAFVGTQLSAFLTSRSVDMVVVCGATTSGCVRATAVDSVSLGFPTFVARECVADRAQGPHDAALFDLQEKYADVEPVSTLVTHLEELAEQRSRA